MTPIVDANGLTYPGYYITDDGRVFSERTPGPKDQKSSRHELTPSVSNKDYLRVTLYRNGKKHRHSLHVLVASTFLGPRPEGMQACHSNGNYRDNSRSNIRWGTPESNYADRAEHGRQPTGYAHKRPNARLTEGNIRMIRELYGPIELTGPARVRVGFKTQRELGKMFNVAWTTIGKIVRREAWSHIK